MTTAKKPTTKKAPIKKAAPKKAVKKAPIKTDLKATKDDLIKAELIADLIIKLDALKLSKLSKHYANASLNMDIQQIKGLIIFFTPDEQ